MMKSSVAAAAASLVLAAVLLAGPSSAAYHYKQLGGPPSEFESHRIPDAAKGAMFQSSANRLVSFTRVSDDLLAYSSDVVVDSPTGFTVSIITPLLEQTKVSLLDPSGAPIDLSSHEVKTFWPVGDSNMEDLALQYQFLNPVVGTYQLSLSVSATEAEFDALMAASTASSSTHGMVLVWNESEDDIFSQLQTYEAMRQGDDVPFRAMMYNVPSNPDLLKNKGVIPTPLKDTVTEAAITVRYPNGTFAQFTMHDDGLHGDLLANDGAFGGFFPATEAGDYFVQTDLVGKTASGALFQRSAEHSITVVEKSLSLTGHVGVDFDIFNARVLFEVEVEQPTAFALRDQQSSDALYHAYLELTGTKLFSSEAVPVAWSGALVRPAAATTAFLKQRHLSHNSDTDADTRLSVLRLETDLKWLLEAKATSPFSFNHMAVKEVNSFTPVAEQDTSLEVAVHMTPSVARAINTTAHLLSKTHTFGVYDEQMRYGVRPAHLREQPAQLTKTSNSSSSAKNVAAGTHKLVLVHGYCTKKNPWKASSDIFTDGIYFLDAEASRTHDQFAKLVLDFAEPQASSYALIGHSQGGIVSTHILNYYWSGTDATKSGRRVQSQGSPYQGNSGAGSWAEILKLLGGCGENNDLGRDGSELWLSGLSGATAPQVYYYTVQYDKGGLFGKGYCNALTNAVLKSPNDGVVENAYAELPGGNYVENFVGQCHIEGMNWPASFLDRSRNQEMNDAAAK